MRARVVFPAGTSFYGTGDVPGPLLRNGRTTTLWNTDASGYGERTPSIYSSHPWLLAVLPGGRAVGLLADTPRRGTIRCHGRAVEMEFEGPFAIRRIEAAGPEAVVRALARRVGRIAMPPLWALGYHQCRFSYGDEKEVRSIARKLRGRRIPCDALWLDIDYQDRFRAFTVDRRRFPHLPRLTRDLRRRGIRTVAILDPAIAIDEEDATYRSGIAGDHFVLDARGGPAEGRSWPGRSHFPDFTSARTREWWSKRVAAFVRANGIDGLWNDMNEPSVFGVRGKTLPHSALHRGLGGRAHREVHNLYGGLMARASREGLARARPDRRPFVLSRAGDVRSARFAATWTGDNASRWDHLRWSIPMALNLGLSSQPFAGPDAGGFRGNPGGELFARWFELAAYLPFFRGHSDKGACRKEPWSFGPRVEAVVRASIERRMRLLPYLYTAFREAHETGAPVVRPVFLADPGDPGLRAIDDAFLLGRDLLVAPVVEPRRSRKRVVLPRHDGGGWYEFPRGERRLEARRHVAGAPLGTTPVFVRAGSIVPTIDARASTAGGFGPVLHLHVFPDRSGKAAGRLYEDAGDGLAHLDGTFRDSRFRFRAVRGETKLDVRARGTWSPPRRETRVVVHGSRAT
jgi:alpha-glucosidase